MPPSPSCHGRNSESVKGGLTHPAVRRSSDAWQKAEVGLRGNVDGVESDLQTGQGDSHCDARSAEVAVVEDLLGHSGYEVLVGFPIVL